MPSEPGPAVRDQVDPPSSTATRSARWPQRAALPAVALAVALAVLAPLLRRGFVLSYDMVFTPRQPLLPDGLGLGTALPRAVPSDAVVALATVLVPGDIVQKVALAAALFFATLGAGRLVPTDSTAVRVIAGLAYGWSTYVAERLFIGHWQILLAYACLPWIALAGLAVRRAEPKAGARLVLTCLPAVLTAPGGMLAALTAVTSAGRRRLPFTVVAMLVLNAPWWLPGLLHPATAAASPEGVDAFAARAENWGTQLTSLLGLGGIWNSEAVPASRGNPLVPLFTLAMLGAAGYGLRVLAQRWGAAPARALALLGAFGVLLAALPTVPAGAALMRWLTVHGPGFALLRDSQRWVAWLALPLALGFALAVEAAAATLRTRAGRAAVLAAAALFPVAVLPDLAWGGFGRMATVSYPDDWARVSAILAEDQRPGDVLTLPAGGFRRFAWNDHRTQLDPAPRVLPRTTVIDDTLLVGGRPVPGEDRRAGEIRRAAGTDLPGLGIGWLLVEHGTPGAAPTLPPGVTESFHGEWLSLYRLPGQVRPYDQGEPPIVAVLVGDVGAVLLIMATLLWLGLPTGRLSPFQRNTTRE
jgi:hypothetical protein